MYWTINIVQIKFILLNFLLMLDLEEFSLYLMTENLPQHLMKAPAVVIVAKMNRYMAQYMSPEKN